MQVNEMFVSIDGEVNAWGQGILSAFIRLQGCNLKCKYCDTPQAIPMKNRKARSKGPAEIVAWVLARNVNKVTITGGEPLLQASKLYQLVRSLLSHGLLVSIETNGSLPIPQWRNLYWVRQLCWVVDLKTEFSAGEEAYRAMKTENFKNLTNNDFIKVVLADRRDFYQAIEFLRQVYWSYYKVRNVPSLALSPAFGEATPAELFDWVMSSEEGTALRSWARKYDIRLYLNVQLHKMIEFR